MSKQLQLMGTFLTDSCAPCCCTALKVAVGRVEAKVNFWDLAGHPEFFEVRNEFYKDTQGVPLTVAILCSVSINQVAVN